MYKQPTRLNQGFTLIEILIVIGIIAILATIVLIAINPARQFAQARNSQRSSNVNTLLNAIGQRIADNKGIFAGGTCPTLIVATDYNITSTVGAGNIDLADCLVPTYISAQLPADPTTGSWTDADNYNTGYHIVLDASGRFTVSAPSTDVPPAGAVISITR